MKPDASDLEALRREVFRRYGRISSRNAKGFLIGLDQALAQAGLSRVQARWRGDPDWGFTATGEYEETTVAATWSVDLRCYQ